MKKLAAMLMVLSLSALTVGCNNEEGAGGAANGNGEAVTPAEAEQSIEKAEEKTEAAAATADGKEEQNLEQAEQKLEEAEDKADQAAPIEENK